MRGLSRGSAWSAKRIEKFPCDERSPLCVAVEGGAGYPMICSLWFRDRDGRLLFGELIDRDLGCRDSQLAAWRLSGAENEVTIAIEPERVTSWDYTARMSPASEASAGC